MSNGIKRLLRSWFELTSQEQTAVIIVLCLFLLGVLARWFHLVS
jgi:hypothetical protein